MAPDSDRLHALFAPALEEVRILGQWASAQSWTDWNTYHRLIALDGLPRERQQRIRRAGRRSWWSFVIPAAASLAQI